MTEQCLWCNATCFVLFLQLPPLSRTHSHQLCASRCPRNRVVLESPVTTRLPTQWAFSLLEWECNGGSVPPSVFPPLGGNILSLTISYHLPSNPAPSHSVPHSQPEGPVRTKVRSHCSSAPNLKKVSAHAVKCKPLFLQPASPCHLRHHSRVSSWHFPSTCPTGFLASPWAQHTCCPCRALTGTPHLCCAPDIRGPQPVTVCRKAAVSGPWLPYSSSFFFKALIATWHCTIYLYNHRLFLPLKYRLHRERDYFACCFFPWA